MKKFTFLVFLISPAISFAQIDFGSPSATARGGSVTATAKDFEAIEINPSNLAWKDNKRFTLSIMNVGLNLQDNSINAKDMEQHINDFEKIFSKGSSDSAANQLFQQAISAPGGLNLHTTVTWAAMSVNIPKLGGLAVNLEDEIYVHAYTNSAAANLLVEGTNSQIYKSALNRVQNASGTNVLNLADSIQAWQNFYSTESTVFNGTSFGGYHYRELNIDYGHKLFTIKTHSVGKGGASFENSEYVSNKAKKTDTVSNPIEIFGGFGFKPIYGLADYNIVGTGSQLSANGTYVNDYPQEIIQQPLANMFHANGRGYGIDLGLSATYKKWKLGVSAIDLGSITWHNNSYISASATTPSVNTIISEIKDSNQSVASVVPIFVSQTQGAEPNYTTQLPSKFRSGISYQLSKGISLSSDFVMPLNSVQGNILNPYWAVGTHINFFGIFNLSVGYATEKGFPNVVPAGIFLSVLGDFEIFVATNDVLALLNNSNVHVLSAAAGIRVIGF